LLLPHWQTSLYFSSDREFERRVLALLQIVWPELMPMHAMQDWDAKGIDLAQKPARDDAPLPLVVQCKGFKVRPIGRDQQRQMLKSVEDFRQSGEHCERYLLIHNREGGDRELAAPIQRALDQLVIDGKASTAELWDLRKFLKETARLLLRALDERLTQRSREMLRLREERLRFGSINISPVPAREGTLELSSSTRWDPVWRNPHSDGDVANLLRAARREQWVLLCGEFGAGKTTSVLHASAAQGRTVLVIPCGDLPPASFGGPTTTLFMSVAHLLDVVPLLPFDDRGELSLDFGRLLARLLRQPNTRFVLVLDGLDENRAFVRLDGLRRLSNTLADLRAPVVLTTRSEHLYSMLADFGSSFEQLSWKHGRRRPRIMQLEPWTTEEVESFVHQAGEAASNDEERERLQSLSAVLANDLGRDLYGDLPSNPFLLALLAEDVVNNGLHQLSRAGLVESWSRKKLVRDRDQTMRAVLDEELPLDAYVEQVMLLMEDIAVGMTEEADGVVELLESIDSETIVDMTRLRFPKAPNSVVPILLTTLLAPIPGSRAGVRFAYRLFHEYFVSRSLARDGRSANAYPGAVQDLMAEIHADAQGPRASD
jgi:hypothetical protein